MAYSDRRWIWWPRSATARTAIGPGGAFLGIAEAVVRLHSAVAKGGTGGLAERESRAPLSRRVNELEQVLWPPPLTG
jgi:hypothetical protein